MRVALHRRYGTATESLADMIAGSVEWRADLDVLECGCGPGVLWTNRHAPRSVSLTLTDLSPAMVDAAVETAGGEGFDDVVGRVCDVQDLPFADDSFDVVFANHMLYHVPDPDLAVSELARVVRPDGIVLAGTNGYGHMSEINGAIAEVFGSHAERLYEMFGIDTGEARLRESFGSVTWHAYRNDLIVDDPDAVIAYGLSFPPGEDATGAQAAAFGAAVRRRFVDGQMRIRTRAGVFVARKPLGIG